MMSLARIERLLSESIGLNPLSIGHSTIRRAAIQRMQALSVSALEDYAVLLARSGTELEALLEGVTVPETWFFRDPAAYEFLASWIRSDWLVRKGRDGLRILSLPCSSGEEPFSIAMCLALAGISQYSILAVDIRHTALARARKALYGRGSFRGQDLEYRETFFEISGELHRLSSRISSKVEFRSGNILDPLLLAGDATFDLVFCRNLMIYLDTAARKIASQNVERWLNDDGILFSGHAETGFAWGNRFVSLHRPRAFVYRKKSDSEPVLNSTWGVVDRLIPELSGGGSQR